MSAKDDRLLKTMNALSGIFLLMLLLGVGGVLWKAMSAFETMTAMSAKMLELAHNSTDKMATLEADARELRIRVLALEATSKAAPKKRRAHE